MTPLDLAPSLATGLLGMGMWAVAAGLARTPRPGNRLPDPHTYVAPPAVAMLVVAALVHVSFTPPYLPLIMLVACGVPAAYTDARELRLPDPLTYGLAGAAVLLVTVLALTGTPGSVLGAVAGGAGYPLLLLAVAVLTPTRSTTPAASTTGEGSTAVLTRPAALGLGDIKLAAGIGILVGWTSTPTIVTALLLTAVGHLVWVIGCSVARRVGLRTGMAGTALGPWMVAGAVAAIALASSRP